MEPRLTPGSSIFSGAAVGERRLALLRELVQIDQDYRRQSGNERPLEAYLHDFPELTDGTNSSRS